MEHGQFFVGQSYLASVSTEQVPVFHVTFEPRCRNNWHIHHAASGGGQMLICVGGRGYYQEWGKEPVEMTPGTVINIPANVKHWHGVGLDFMEAYDLYALFGNALDNMIESVSKEQPQNRIASLLIAPKNGFLTIALDNYCSREIQFINGFPKTTKEDNGYHGFGTRSMQYIVRKYGGTMTMRQDTDMHRFILSIMFS